MSPGQFLTLEDLAEMPYASKVVKESLRMASVVPWFPRLALQDCEIEGFKIKKGWNVNVDAKSIHLDPNQYNEPSKFNPSRFNVSPTIFQIRFHFFSFVFPSYFS
ncbi:CYTOCHROME P450 26 [Salix viminalis]|uniref:CYTOCHROME P450 26 n=1 Tax=Salix viminalis TaxID=40686 RepID=A0A9Q0QCN8_SALVM|nr:CYTOCHROME P450 26 [Salix viminalis]